MGAGQFDRSIRLETSVATRTPTGEKSRSWSTVATAIPAKVELPSSRQVMNSQAVQSEIDAVFTIRFRTDITPDEAHRIVYNGVNYRIKGVREIGRRVALQLDCTARAE